MSSQGGAESTPFEQFGGHPFFESLVDTFYELVEQDEILRPMYPTGSLEPARWRLRAFLEQYWGGPNEYSEQRGHPRLRMRHAGFHIDSAARDRWLAHMRAALDEQALSPQDDSILWQYLHAAALAMQNVADDLPPGSTLIAEPSA